MANAKTINGTVSKNNYEFYVELSESWNSSTYSQTNKTTVSYAVYLKNHGTRTDSNHWTFSASYDGVSVYNATEQNVKTNDVAWDGGVKQLFSGSFEVTHNNDGAKTIAFSASITKSSPATNDPGNCYASGNYTLTTIPRYFSSKPTLTLSTKDETSVTLNWTTPEKCSTVQYKLNNGSWVDVVADANATSGSYTITGLNPNTTYTIAGDFKRRDSGLWATTSPGAPSLNVTTHGVATISLVSKTETTATMRWTTSVKCSTVQYRLTVDGSTGSWVDVVADANATSGQYTISGLTAGKTYKIEGDYKLKDTGSWSQTKPYTNVTMYSYPYVSNCQNFTIGDRISYYIYNPLNRQVVVNFKGNDGSQICTTNTITNNGNATVSSNASEIAAQYASIPNSKQGTYTVQLICSALSRTTTHTGAKYNIKDNGTEIPTFNNNQWNYATNYVNTSVAVRNKSSVVVTVNSTATSDYGANLNGYAVQCGNKPNYITSQTGSTTLANVSDSTLIVTARDKRGLTKPTNKTIQIIEYDDQTGTVKVDRTDGVGTDVFLNLNGTYYTGKLYIDSSTQADNTITKIYYNVSTTTEYDDNNDTEIPIAHVTMYNGNYNLSNEQIFSDGSSAGFTIGTKYNVRIKVQDRFQTKAFYGTITDGKLAVDCYQDSNGDYHRGINGLGSDNYTQTIHGSEYVEGLLQYGENGRRDYHDAGFIYDKYGNLRHKRSNVGDNLDISGYDGDTTIRIYPETGRVESEGQYIRSKGSRWIDGRDLATVRNNQTNNDGSFYPVVAQKTKNGNWSIGSLGNNDNLIFDYTTDTNYNNNTNNSVRWTLDTSGNFSGNAATATTAAACSGNAATATTAASCSGNAATATKATKDASGNTITSTYAKNTDIFFQKNETWKIDEWYSGAYVTSSTTTIKFTIPLPKRKGSTSSVSITGGTISVRASTGGYLENSLALPNAKVTVKYYRDGYITIYITNSTAYSTTNNTPVGIELDNLTLKFT